MGRVVAAGVAEATPLAGRRRTLRWLAAVAIAAACGHAIVAEPSRATAARPGDAFAAFCTPAPAEARASVTQRADRELDAAVPPATPVDGDSSANNAEVTKGDVVRLRVSSSRKGAVAVHGLLESQPVAAGETSVVAFRAIYTGRFPLHFHGADGAHFEIAALEVRRRPAESAGR